MAVTFEDIRRDPTHGYWQARITDTETGFALNVDRKWGSWTAEPVGEATTHRREIQAWIAAELQRRVRKLEREELARADSDT
jgi:hypothetical protein